jgi:hypothetical protein
MRRRGAARAHCIEPRQIVAARFKILAKLTPSRVWQKRLMERRTIDINHHMVGRLSLKKSNVSGYRTPLVFNKGRLDTTLLLW